MRSLLDIRDRINERVATVKETVEQFDEEIAEYKKQLKVAGFPVETFAIKGREIKLIKERKWYQRECDKLRSQLLDVNRLIYASEAFKHAQQMVSDLEGNMKGLVDASNEIIESLIKGHIRPDASNEILESFIQGHGYGHNLPDECKGLFGRYQN